MTFHKPNRLLDSLSTEASNLLLAHATTVDLALRASLYEAEQTPAFAYFITSRHGLHRNRDGRRQHR